MAKNITTVSPFYRSTLGEEDNILAVAPFVVKPLADDVPTTGRAYYELQDEVIIPSNGGLGGFIPLEGALQIIPIKGDGFESPINAMPFGNTDIKEGSTVTLFGTSNVNPPKMINSRTINYGVWLNGSVTFYEGYTIQLQLVKLGNFFLWLQISKNF